MNIYKRYVDVVLRHDRDGTMTPLYLCWDDGRRFFIDKVLGMDRRASQAGGCGIRYDCMIQGNRRNLFLEKDKWFIESYRP